MTPKPKLDWKSYEEVVKKIYECLGQMHGVQIIGYGNQCKVKGKSGISHQIDVLTGHSDGLHSYKTAVECKFWNDKVDKDVIMKLKEIIDDAYINKGIVVSQRGFTQDAITFAKFNDIGLVELREPNEEDWKGRVKDITVNINMIIPTIKTINFMTTEENSVTKLSSLIIDEYVIKFENGETKEVRKYIKELIKDIKENEEGKEFDQIIRIDKNSILTNKTMNIEVPITGIKVTGVIQVIKSGVEIKGEDHIWLIMNSIFDKKRFTISPDGEISEKENDR